VDNITHAVSMIASTGAVALLPAYPNNLLPWSVTSRPRMAQVMTREVATCGEAESAVSIMGRMTTGKFRHIPVIERDELVGIVSIGDIVKHRLCEMEQESAALRDYIQSA
jgi:CBS domain-containing protein